MPWLTPDSIPEVDDCRPLSIPADSVWLALVSGALTELTLPYNWEQFGTLTIQETVDKMQSIIDNYYASPCAECLTPGDYRVTRISPEGHLEELAPDGTWQPASGDYAIPAPEARTGGTDVDQNCLAAKNATNTLHTLYDSLSDSFASELTTDEAITAFIAAAIAAIGFEFAPVTWSIAATGFVIFEALFKALEYVTADLWTDAFSDEFICLLLGCVNNDAGVVTFDWDCFNNALLEQVNNMGLSEVQMRLYVQIGYILNFIGGVDGLNLAARTTAITDDACSCNWCGQVDFTTGLHGWTLVTGTQVDGTGLVQGVVSDGSDEYSYIDAYRGAFDSDASTLNSTTIYFTKTYVGSALVDYLAYKFGAGAPTHPTDDVMTHDSATNTSPWAFTTPTSVDAVRFNIDAGFTHDGIPAGTATVTHIIFEGVGIRPGGLTDC
jgi:hypothetical protein